MKLMKYSALAGNGKRSGAIEKGEPIKFNKSGTPRCKPDRDKAKKERQRAGALALQKVLG